MIADNYCDALNVVLWFE